MMLKQITLPLIERLRAPTYPTLKRQVAELEVEVGGLTSELDSAGVKLAAAAEALAAQRDAMAEEHDALMERLMKERRKYREWQEQNAAPARGYKLAREALDIIRYSPLANVTDPALPRYSADYVIAEARRIENELGH